MSHDDMLDCMVDIDGKLNGDDAFDSSIDEEAWEVDSHDTDSGTHNNGITNGNNTIDLSIRHTGRPPTKIKDPSIARRPRGRPIKDVNEPRKQPIYAGDIQSDIHSSKCKSDRLKEKIRMKRQKIFDQGFLGDNGATNGIDTRKRSFNGISKDYKDHGDPIFKCVDCDALLWHAESVVGSTHSDSGSFSLCCGRGKVMLTNEVQNPPQFLLDLITGKNPKSEIQGENYHLMGTLLPEKDKKPAFAQLYTYDKANEIQNRINEVSGEPTMTSGASTLDHKLTVDLRDMLDSINPLVAQFRMAENGTVGYKNDCEDMVKFPDNMLIPDSDDHVATIIKEVYPNLKDNLYTSGYFQERAILAPTHELVDMINDRMLDLISGHKLQ
ncbi:hypothetical protein CTI12_AA419740 [Artemisia annua]|uniref:Uncharacterized protein n=1 Tax=Artemisia annua TaxID=35608 RepID=A0A2U1M503_ARTAN|nr:hypothetical protein CTI12_AA419740 [Artemisia annua]